MTPPRPLRLGLDLDGVFADFNGHPDTHGFARELVKVSGRDLFPRPWAGPPVWDWMSALGYKPSEIAAAWAAIDADPLWWRHLRALDERPTWDALTQIADWETRGLVQPVFLTNRPSPTAHFQSAGWLSHYMTRPQVCVCETPQDKGRACRALGLDALVDDMPEVLAGVRDHSHQTRPILFVRPWNAGRIDAERGWGSHLVRSHAQLIELLGVWLAPAIEAQALAATEAP